VENCDEDLGSAYAELRRRVGEKTAVFVLGFSLGSGIAARGVASLEPAPAGLFLCEAFTSYREAARAAGVPKRLMGAVPDVWNTVEAMGRVRLPVCVVHSDGDRLFPVEMARRIAEACGEWGELVVAHGLTHNEPYRRPGDEYWGAVVERVLHGSGGSLGATCR
jgi:alpha-beta hydrolase superfamily lysophospholipase